MWKVSRRVLWGSVLHSKSGKASTRHVRHLKPTQSFRLSTGDSNNETPSQARSGFWDGLIEKHGEHRLKAPDGYNRWRMVPYAVSTHLCLGACYAWSIFNAPLSRELGVIAPSAGDWPLSSVTGTFMGIIVAQGLAMALCGKWVERVGPRIAGLTGSALYGGGMLLGALGVYTHQIPLLYLGYGAIAGSGMGITYLPPVATLVRWFPDKRGLATGMAICGFGGGAIIIAQLKKKMMAHFAQQPTFVGDKSEVATQVSDSGALLASVGDRWVEVINASTTDLAAVGAQHLQEGLYLVGSGNTGAAATMGALGLGYLVVCMGGASVVKTPREGWTPEVAAKATEGREGEGKAPPKPAAPAMNTVHIDDVMKTPQFWLQWVTFLSTATAGMGLMSVAKDMVTTCFCASAIAGSAAATTYVQALSFANLSGRFCWASASDFLGRKNTFAIFCVAGAPMYAALPFIVAQSLQWDSFAPLALFYGSTMFIISFFGGGYSTIPAYESDLFGTKYIAAIHGRMMTASALSGLSGPMIFSRLRDREEVKAIAELAAKCDVGKFQEKFGVSVDKLDTLIESKAVSISRLLEILPPETKDPSPYLYDPAFRAMGGVLACGAVANFLVRPVNSKWLMKN